MASIFDSLLGQQNAPNLTVPTSQDILSQIYNSVPGIANATVNYNNLLAPGIAGAQRKGEDIYDPNRGAIRDTSGALIRKTLANPYQVPEDVGQQVRQAGFQQGSITGGGESNSAQANVARNYGLTSLDIGNANINRGANYGANTANLWQPQGIGVNPGEAGSLFANQTNQQNAVNTYMSNLDYQNSMNLINRPLQLSNALDDKVGKIFSTIMSMYGGGAMGGGGGGSSIANDVPLISGGGGSDYSFNNPYANATPFH